MDRPTDRQTELQTDKPSYRSFLPELKKVKKVQLKEAKFWKRKSPKGCHPQKKTPYIVTLALPYSASFCWKRTIHCHYFKSTINCQLSTLSQLSTVNCQLSQLVTSKVCCV